jgi:hypothetical protein
MAPSLSRGGQKEFGEGGRASRFGLARLWVTSDRLAMADQCPLLLRYPTLNPKESCADWFCDNYHPLFGGH